MLLQITYTRTNETVLLPYTPQTYFAAWQGFTLGSVAKYQIVKVGA